MADSLMELQQVRKNLVGKTQSLEQIEESRAMLWQELGWSRAQIRLWLRCLPEIEAENVESDNPSYHIKESEKTGDDLGEIIAKVVDALGKPVPLAELIKKLPTGTIATEPMIKAAIQQHPNLVLTGPVVRLNRK